MAIQAEARVTNAPFPIRSKQSAVTIQGSRTEIMAMYFTDKIVLTIAQDGRLAHWVSLSSSLHTLIANI